MDDSEARPSCKPGVEWHHYRGRHIPLLTQHGKEAIIGPVLNDALGCKVERVKGFDTDQLGTFTRDIERAGSQLEAARRKARIGMALSGCSLGLASEGAFVPDPYTGLLPWNVELVIFIDDERGLEVVGTAHGPARSGHHLVQTRDKLLAFAKEAGFPEHGLVLRPNDEHDTRMRKGLADQAELEQAYDWVRSLSRSGMVSVENDLRAHCNPTRQTVIRQATVDLAQRLASACPACALPGFWISGKVEGLPCRACGLPTHKPIALVWRCDACGHREERPWNVALYADPGRCGYCNP